LRQHFEGYVLLCYAIARFELYELYFISVKVLKVQVKNKVHKVRTSQQYEAEVCYRCDVAVSSSLIISSQAGRQTARALLSFKRPTRRHRTATVPIIGNFQFGVGLRQMILLPEF